MKSPFYSYPMLYDFGIRFLYFDALKILKDIIGKNKSVFEPACGYGRIKNYLYPDCTYSGIDLNETFINYGKKKNRDIDLGNALDESKFKEADTILLCDILHHLKIKDIYTLVAIAAKFAKEKVVIVEPVFVDIGARNNFLSRFIGNIMKVIDSDGFNDIERWLSKEEYDTLFHSLKDTNNFKEMNVKVFRKHDFVEMFV